MKIEPINVLIPCYNEAPRIAGVLGPLSRSKYINKIIVVDDASQDYSYKVASGFNKVKLIRLKKNVGKGGALRQGISYVETESVMLMDADLKGLKVFNVEKMVKEHFKDPESLVVGMVEKDNKLLLNGWLRNNISPLISGQRVLPTKDLIKILSKPVSSHYGVEPYMNYYFRSKRKKIKKVPLKKVYNILKYNKESYGVRPHVDEAFHIFNKYVQVYAKEMPKDLYAVLKSFIYPTFGGDAVKYKTHKIKVGNISINYAKVGSGPALVLLHGLTNNWECWIPCISYLKDSYTLYIMDAPGYGDSGNLENYSIEIFADYVSKFIKKLSLDPISVIGLSLGGLISAEFGKKYPDFSKSIVICGPIIKEGNTSVLAKTLRYSLWVVSNFSLSERALKKIIETRVVSYAVSKYANMYKFNRFLVDQYGIIGKRKMRERAFVKMGISVGDYDLRNTLKGYLLPTLLLYGKEDRLSSYKHAKKVVIENNKNLKLSVIPDAGHIVSMEKPKETAEEVKRFLGGLN